MNTTILNAAMAILFAAIGYSVCALLSVAKKSDVALSSAPTEKNPEKEKTTILTPGCSVKYQGRIWTIRQFTEDSKRQTIAEIENYDNEKHIIRRTMAAVDDLEAVE